MFKNYVTLLAMSLCLYGCGPIYRTFHYYHEPESQRGRDCIITCQTMTQKCEHWSEQAYQSCMQRKSLERVATSIFAPRRYDSPFVGHHHYDGDCRSYKNSQNGVCLADYNSCYQLCGGVVDSVEECVANCEEKE